MIRCAILQREEKPQLNPSQRHRWKTLITVGFILLFLAEIGLVIQQERAQRFAAKAQKAGSDLIDFAETRAELLQRKPNESFAQYEQRISAEDAVTQSLYASLYSGQVASLRDEFARRGLRRPALDEFYQKPGSAIGVREVGKTLFDMGAELRSASVSIGLKGWWRRPALDTR
jgi:hypothetical protein